MYTAERNSRSSSRIIGPGVDVNERSESARLVQLVWLRVIRLIRLIDYGIQFIEKPFFQFTGKFMICRHVSNDKFG